MTLLPHPYGLVAAIPKPFGIPIYKLNHVAKNKSLWKKKTTVIGENAVMLSNSSKIENILLSRSYDFDFNFRFNEHQLEIASLLSQIYSKLRTEDLNILGSHRNTEKSKSCVEYAFRVWETSYQRILSALKSSEDISILKMKKDLLSMARCCEQIEIKIKYIQKDIKLQIDNYENLSDEICSGNLERSLVSTIVDYMKRKSKLTESDDSNFDGQCKTNRNFLYPVTELCTSFFESKFDEKLDKRKEILNMREVLSSYSSKIKESELGITLSGELRSFMENIEKIHSQALTRHPIVLRKFRDDKYTSINWKIDDGRGEINAN